jgi:hypothetical protein
MEPEVPAEVNEYVPEPVDNLLRHDGLIPQRAVVTPEPEEENEPGYFGEELYCHFCGKKIRFRFNPGYKALPVECEVRYFTKNTNGPCRFVDPSDGKPYRGFIYAKKYNGTIPGYMIHSCREPKGGRG